MLELHEYETRLAVPLRTTQRDQLRTLTSSVVLTPSVGYDGRYDLTAGSHVGAIHLDGLDIMIRPKILMARLLFMLSYALGNVRWLDHLDLSQALDLPEAIIPVFVHQVQAALRRGVLQAYRSRDEASLTIRGRWRVSEQIRRRFGLAPPAEITYDDYTVDNELNRILLAATVRLQRLRLRSQAARVGLRSVAAHLEGVSAVSYDPRRLPKIRFDRLTERYRPAVQLALFVIGATSFDLGPGVVPGSAFLVDMNKAFEDFVVAALRDALGLSSRQLVQGSRGHTLYLDEERRVKLEPDLAIWLDRRPIWIADAKYKRLSPAQFPNADVYQATSYAVAAGLEGALLIYAAGEGEPAVHTIVDIGKRIEIVSLDLSGAPDAILAEVGKLAGVIKGRLFAHSPVSFGHPQQRQGLFVSS